MMKLQKTPLPEYGTKALHFCRFCIRVDNLACLIKQGSI